jgi:NAD-dependent DNA ligase
MATDADADADGKAISSRFNSSRLADRAIDELIGLCKGVLADGIVDEAESKFLLSWLGANRHARDQWPASVLYPRLVDMLSDGVLDEDEQAELLDLVIDITGGGLAPTPVDASMSSTLPVCDPPPQIIFDHRAFCLTGKFASGTRAECQKQVIGLGGNCTKTPTRETDYVVIGTIGSRDWVHSTHGRKIEKAVELRDSGTGLHILTEEYWAECVAQSLQ